MITLGEANLEVWVVKGRRKPKAIFPVDESGLLKSMAGIVDKKRERKEEKKRRREARKLKHERGRTDDKETNC